MSCYIGQYVKTCDLCCQTKLQHCRPTGELHPSETPNEPWDTISVAFIVKLPHSSGYDAIMNVVNGVTKHAHFIAMHTTITAVGAARLFLCKVWEHPGPFRIFVSPRGPQFIADCPRKLYRLIGIKLATSTAYHPQTDGQTKRVNQELEQFLRLFVNQRQDDWEELLALGEFQYNNHVHSSTQQTPFMVDSGRHPRMGFEPLEPRSKLASVNDFVD